MPCRQDKKLRSYSTGKDDQSRNGRMSGCVIDFCISDRRTSTCGKFVQYLGNAAIPLSMIITGVSLAKMPLIEVFKDIKMYQFTFLKMLVIPVIAAFVVRLFHLNPVLSGIMVLMFGMPNGSMAVMMAIDYGLDSSICSRGIVLTTLLSIITLPIVAYLI